MEASRQAALLESLREAERDFDPQARLPNDPLGLVRALRREDWEVGAHIASALAYGGVPLLRRAIGTVFDALDRPLHEAVAALEPGDFRARAPEFVYRMTRAIDVDAYLVGLGRLLREYGSLHAAFASGDDGGGDARAPLTRYVQRIRSRMPHTERGARYLTPDPASGSATKRWYLMLRWLVRPDDGVDLGLWTDVGPHRLVLPLDTHVSRLVRALGMTERRTADYRMAREATDVLLALDRADPLRFDMPLCHLGIAKACLHRWEESVCTRCALRPVCVWGQEASV